ncbi:hypothetical protein AGOR_G00110440 [Albula goreensis]|uniref:Ubiquitin-like protease family profile domain-containing protein n=1 Tax=Albula goreensis TaxID=1534307 RepID=A0A8T3DIX4_9TELE|nr:hypothetical protein AGOR_G00110440 [Albula goreensis]
MMPNTNYFMSPPPSQGLVFQGRLFHHANTPAAIRKPPQRKDYAQEIQRVELDSIILTCPEMPDTDDLFGGNVQRRVQSRRRRLCDMAAGGPEPLRPDEYFTVCGRCSTPSENHISCQNCGNPLSSPTAAPSFMHSSAPLKEPRHYAEVRPPISSPSMGPSHPQYFNSFYNPPLPVRAPQMDTTTMTPPFHASRGCLLSSNHTGGGMCALSGPVEKPCRGGKNNGIKQPEPSDTIVLSSDEEEDEEGSVCASRMDSISPCPADSAHSSPVPTVGRNPRKMRMKDPSGNPAPKNSCISHKRRKILLVSPVHTCMRNHAVKQDSIVLDCRSVRLGTLRRMVTKPVIFSLESIQIETEAPKEDVLEKVELRASELTSCEWCCVRKLPTLFLQTTPAECLRLRVQLSMSRDNGGVWYDCKSTDPDERLIVLIFEKGLTIPEEVLLEEILKEIGKKNKLQGFPTRLPFQEANARLVRYNNKTRDKKASQKPSQKTVSMNDQCCVLPPPALCPPVPVPQPDPHEPHTDPHLPAHLQPYAHCSLNDEEAEDMEELTPTFSGVAEKIMVYPPPPAKGGICVTNEDLLCLNSGEFLNDVIIDFYLKYLVLEKLRREDAHRIHVFSSFFYKRLNQRERKNGSDANQLPMQKKKHNRVKTWTRHVDLFQKDFIFVPINEAAHWFLAVICFPGLEGPRFDPNPLYQVPGALQVHNPPDEHQLPFSWAETAGYCDQSYPCMPTSHCLRVPSYGPMGTCTEPMMTWDCASEEMAPGSSHIDGLHRIGMYESRSDNTYQFHDDQSSCEDEGSEDGLLDLDGLDDSRNTEWRSRPTICKQPCILIMDSLRGPGRSTVVKTLREYLEVEWEVRKGTRRSFGKEVMRGSSPRVPQQDNFSDCGVYVLQYVESFFQNPIPSFDLPMNLMEWFPQQRMRRKREEVKELILHIQSRQQTDPYFQGPPLNTDPHSLAYRFTASRTPWGH